MHKKNLIITITTLVIILGVIAGAFYYFTESKKAALEDELIIFNWENYLDPDIIKEFEEKFGVKVTQEYFDDSSYMFSAVQSQPGKYDLIMAADDSVKEMIDIKLLSPLAHRKIANIKNLKKEATENYYDPGNNYCLPYFSGYTGIVVNTKYIKDYDGSRKIFWDEKYKGKISMPNNSFEVLLNAFFQLGYNLENPTEEQLEAARKLALKQKDLVIGYNDTSEQRDLMVSGKAWIAYTYTTEIPYMIKQNSNLKFFAPKEGVVLWTDNWCIPKDAPHKNAAHAFLNYLLEPEVSAKNSEYVGVPMLNGAMEKFLGPEFSSAMKGLDFPADKEVFLKSSYCPGFIAEKVQVVSNQLWSDLGIEE